MQRNKGFTLVEVLVCFVLLGLLMLCVFSIASYTSSLAVTQRVEESLVGILITSIEESNAALQESGNLLTGKTATTGETGNIEYSLVKTVEQLKYPGAFKLSVAITAKTGESINEEVVLYANT